MKNVTLTALLLAIAGAALYSGAYAADTATEVQRDTHQQARIEQGLQSGSLTTQEAGRLEQDEARIDRNQANAERNGNLSAAEKARIQREQNQVSQAITRDKSNGAVGNPNSESSQRLQADVQRNINQDQRIENGVKNDTLTHREAGALERGQAKVDQREARAARNGHVGANEQRHIQNAENRQSNHIYNKKHNDVIR
ncbi:hypothetical protein [Amantichitinum ursilacus]|uniref:Phage infection protein n=1 Tax=Amantichitinum ursilacus TaxID=857265 RepID=A0A0N0GPF7_9NEIS|nr:hypothetical protein [Amantichitinum ursilacus]KPC53434.1 hypothetical protein WG78_10115 [Amantichitinum ursilacus]